MLMYVYRDITLPKLENTHTHTQTDIHTHTIGESIEAIEVERVCAK